MKVSGLVSQFCLLSNNIQAHIVIIVYSIYRNRSTGGKIIIETKCLSSSSACDSLTMYSV